jgi:hypothetical protein
MQPSAWACFSFSKFISSSRPSPLIPKPLMTPNEQLSVVEQRLFEASGILLDQLSDSVSQAGPVDVGKFEENIRKIIDDFREKKIHCESPEE